MAIARVREATRFVMGRGLHHDHPVGNGALRSLIVLAEDNAELRELLAAGLERVGYTVVQAKNGADLVDKVERSASEIALIVTDVRMPELDGLAAIRRLRDAGIATPVIVMTAFGDTLARDAARNLNSRWIDKPIGLNKLRAAVATTLTGEGK